MTRAIAYAGFVCAVLAFAVAMCTGIASAHGDGDADPCGAEPVPVQRVYLPAVAREVPAMSWEYTPAQPVPTVTPEVKP